MPYFNFEEFYWKHIQITLSKKMNYLSKYNISIFASIDINFPSGLDVLLLELNIISPIQKFLEWRDANSERKDDEKPMS